jgi:hypothetical protein
VLFITLDDGKLLIVRMILRLFQLFCLGPIDKAITNIINQISGRKYDTIFAGKIILSALLGTKQLNTTANITTGT